MEWLVDCCYEVAKEGTLQPMYGIDGELEVTEVTLDHLERYRCSAPVRIGNGAYRQKQLDVYGELMDAIYIYNRYDNISYGLWQHMRQLLTWLKRHWQDPDEGIWEVCGGPKPFVHSRVMSWVAFDRALRVAAQANRWADGSVCAGVNFDTSIGSSSAYLLIDRLSRRSLRMHWWENCLLLYFTRLLSTRCQEAQRPQFGRKPAIYPVVQSGIRQEQTGKDQYVDDGRADIR